MGAGDTACGEIAEKQSGLISRDQAIRTGMSERAIGRRLGGGRWRQVLPGVYRLAGVPTSWEQSLKAATLWGGEGCVVSHRAAAALHGLAGFARQGVEVQSSKRLQRSDVIVHRTCFTSYPARGGEIAALSGVPSGGRFGAVFPEQRQGKHVPGNERSPDRPESPPGVVVALAQRPVSRQSL